MFLVRELWKPGTGRRDHNGGTIVVAAIALQEEDTAAGTWEFDRVAVEAALRASGVRALLLNTPVRRGQPQLFLPPLPTGCNHHPVHGVGCPRLLLAVSSGVVLAEPVCSYSHPTVLSSRNGLGVGDARLCDVGVDHRLQRRFSRTIYWHVLDVLGGVVRYSTTRRAKSSARPSSASCVRSAAARTSWSSLTRSTSTYSTRRTGTSAARRCRECRSAR